MRIARCIWLKSTIFSAKAVNARSRVFHSAGLVFVKDKAGTAAALGVVVDHGIFQSADSPNQRWYHISD